MEPDLVERVGRYEIRGEYGKGAMGVVYRAEDPTIGRMVALKATRVDAEGIDSKELLQRFRLEAHAAGVLSHPNIVTIYDAGEHESLFYIAMEAIEGQTLQARLQERKPLPIEETIEIGTAIALGLDYAHSHGVIHRDIKPANIMLTPGGGVKIMDFGIAKGVGKGITSTGQVLGTPSYMSPEQVRGRQLDGRSDLFSLGVILYEMVTGEKPFTGDNVTTIIYKIAHEEPIPPRNLEATVHPGLSAVILKALAKSPEDRYQLGADLAQDLRNYKLAPVSADAAPRGAVSAQAPVAAGAAAAAQPAPVQPAVAASPAQAPAPAAPRAGGSTAGLWVGIGLALFLMVAIVVGGGIYWWHRRSAARQAIAQQVEQPSTPEAAPPPSAPAETPEQPASAEETPPADASTPPVTVPTPTPTKSVPAAKPATTTAKPATTATDSAKPAPAFGEMTLYSTPDGASVEIDGRTDPKWLTPLTHRLAPGSHHLVFRKEGYTAETREVFVMAGQKSQIASYLGTPKASLSLDSTPPGAEISVDGKTTGKQTPATIVVEPGEHQVSLAKQGYHTEQTKTPRLKSGESFRYAPALYVGEGRGGLKGLFGGGDKGVGTLAIITSPAGAEVLLDGQRLPQVTPLNLPVSAGKHRLVIRKDGYKDLEKKIEIKRESTTSLDELLKAR